MEIKICDLREKLMKCWKQDTRTFKTLRDECGTYVFDAVMAVILGGTGTSKPEHKEYITAIFNKMDASSWKANAGLKANLATGYNNYQQRGFFNYPVVDNKRIKSEFVPDMTIEAVCERVKSYPAECFRNNARNAFSNPADDFVKTLCRIMNYAGIEVSESKFLTVQPDLVYPEPLITEEKKTDKKSVPDMKEVYEFLQQNESEIADSISYASELLLSELDNALKSLKKYRADIENCLIILNGNCDRR